MTTSPDSEPQSALRSRQQVPLSAHISHDDAYRMNQSSEKQQRANPPFYSPK